MTESSNERIDPAAMAALLDGTLSSEERDRILSIIARSPASYEDFLEAVATLAELDASAQPMTSGPVASSPVATDGSPVETARPAPEARRRSSRRRWAAAISTLVAAAAAAIVVALRLNVRLNGDESTSGTPAWTVNAGSELLRLAARGNGAVEATFGPDWSTAVIPSTRGSADRELGSTLATVGATIQRLGIARRMGDSVAVVGEIAALSRELLLIPGAEPWIAKLPGLGSQDSATAAALRSALSSDVRQLGPWPGFFDLGALIQVEQGALLEQNTSLFLPTSPAMRALARLLVDSERLSEPWRTDAARLAEVARGIRTSAQRR